MVNTFQAPPSVVATWPKPNYTNPQTHGPGLTIVVVVLSALGIVTVAARMYARIFLTRAPGADDALIILSLMLSLGLGGLIILGDVSYGANRHIYDIPFSMFPGHRRNIFMSEWLYVSAAASIKISILIFYRRLSVSFTRTFRIAVIVGFLYNIMVLMTCLIWMLSLCQPIKSYWKSYNLEWAANNKYHCRNERVSLPLSGALNVVGDLYSTLLPFLLINDVARSPRQKLALYCLFALGFFTVICGAARTAFLYTIMNVNYDVTWDITPMWFWTYFELYVGILAASAPALKPLIRRFITQKVSNLHLSHRGTTPLPFQGKELSPNASNRNSSRMDGRFSPQSVGIVYTNLNSRPTKEPIVKETYIHTADDISESYELPQRLSSPLATPSEESLTSLRTNIVNIGK